MAHDKHRSITTVKDALLDSAFKLPVKTIETILAFLAAFTLTLIFATASHGLNVSDYTLGPGDLIRVTVYGHDDLTTESRVGGDGSITLPLIGSVEVSDSTTLETEARIARLLEDGYVIKAHVTVFILEYKSKKVSVLGEFVKAGTVELRGDATLLEVISDAGGITPMAGDKLYIQRQVLRTDPASGKVDETTDVTVTVDLKKLLEEGDLSANVPVLNGDSIYVPRAAFVYVTGEVRNPDAYKITKGLTVLKAITLAGGFTDMASKSRVKVLRTLEDGTLDKISVELDYKVQPEDIIEVPESFF